MKTELLKISDIVVDMNLYPRYKPNELLISRYIEALVRKESFPPICVGLLNGEYILIDGLHRLRAFKDHGEDYIASEILLNLSKEDIFAESVYRNTNHGKNLSDKDKIRAIKKLAEMGFSKEDIFKCVRSDIKKFERKISSLVSNKISEIKIEMPKQTLDSFGLDAEYPDKIIKELIRYLDNTEYVPTNVTSLLNDLKLRLDKFNK